MHSEETKRKISKSCRGRIFSIETRQKISKAIKKRSFSIGEWHKGKPAWNKGKKASAETLKKLSLAHLGIPSNRKGIKLPIEWRKNISRSHLGQTAWNKGLKLPQLSGENHPNWIKDRTKLQKYQNSNRDRRSSAYRDWRQNVWLRDNYKCKIDNQDCNGRLEAHHILSYTNYPELRYEINNGITLCHAHYPRVRAEEKRLIPYFMGLVSVSKVSF